MNYIVKILLNSLYGKFGINPGLISYEFISKDQFNKSSSIYKDFVDFGNFILAGKEDKANRIFSNVAVASTVTSFARIAMSVVKNNENIILLYTDTDSAYILGILPEELVSSTELGKFKLEDSYYKFISLGPKVYGTLNINEVEKTKVKGFKDKVSLEKLESLLVKDFYSTLNHEKWFKHMNSSMITVKMTPYDLRISDSKRIAIYENNKFSNTKALSI